MLPKYQVSLMVNFCVSKFEMGISLISKFVILLKRIFSFFQFAFFTFDCRTCFRWLLLLVINLRILLGIIVMKRILIFFIIFSWTLHRSSYILLRFFFINHCLNFLRQNGIFFEWISVIISKFVIIIFFFWIIRIISLLYFLVVLFINLSI